MCFASGRWAQLSVHPCAELGPAYPECLKPRLQDPDGRVPTSTLHITHVGPVKSRTGSQGLLAEASLATKV